MYSKQKEKEIFLYEEKDFFSFVAHCANIFDIGDIVGLRGEVGAGKTTFARALLRSICHDPSLEVPSPTFTLLQEYVAPGNKMKLYHLDLYRIQNPQELDHLGLDDLFQGGCALIEWPEKSQGKIIETCRIEFFHEVNYCRRILLRGDAARLENIMV